MKGMQAKLAFAAVAAQCMAAISQYSMKGSAYRFYSEGISPQDFKQIEKMKKKNQRKRKGKT